jgi:hypothetical protein
LIQNVATIVARASFVCVCFFSIALQQSPAQQQPAPPPQVQAPQQSAGSQAQIAPEQPAPVPAPQISAPEEQFNTGRDLSLTLSYWLTSQQPTLRTGKADTSGSPSDLSSLGGAKASPSIEGVIPIGKLNLIRISYFRTLGDGNITAPVDLDVFGTTYSSGTVLATNYTLQNAKVSFEYLSWPFPVKSSRFRFKTLYEVQVTWIHTTVNAPALVGELDAAGNAIQTIGSGTDWFIYPSFGVGFDYLASKNFRIETKATGFAFPHFSTVWDAEVSANYRIGHFEIQAGAKAFHFKTSPRETEYALDTLGGPFVGLRWYPRRENR